MLKNLKKNKKKKKLKKKIEYLYDLKNLINCNF